MAKPRTIREMTTAQDILNSHWDGTVPVPVAAIARALGIQVSVADIPNPCNLEFKDAYWSAILRKEDSAIRQRFALAHGVGRIVAYDGAAPVSPVDIPATDFSTQATDWNIRKANAFALELLAPKRVLLYAINTGKMRTLEDLAATFQISQVAMVQRLKQVGVI